MSKWICTRFHMVIHGLFGLIVAYFMLQLYPGLNQGILIILCLVGSFLPDLDHLLFFYTYGRRNPYSLQVKEYIRAGKWKKAAKHCAAKHKELTGLYSHSFWSVGVLLVTVWWSMSVSGYITVLLVSMVFHFGFDIAEVLLLIGSLNPNWFGRFDRS